MEGYTVEVPITIYVDVDTCDIDTAKNEALKEITSALNGMKHNIDLYSIKVTKTYVGTIYIKYNIKVDAETLHEANNIINSIPIDDIPTVAINSERTTYRAMLKDTDNE